MFGCPSWDRTKVDRFKAGSLTIRGRGSDVGACGGTRTHTVRSLKPPTLPIGLRRQNTPRIIGAPRRSRTFPSAFEAPSPDPLAGALLAKKLGEE